MPRDDSPLAPVADAIREGRIIGPLAAELFAAQAIEDHQAARRVSAHSNTQLAPGLHQAIDQHLGLAQTEGEDDDAYSGLFPPSTPLGHQVQDTPQRVEHAAHRRHQVRRAAPLTDDQLHAALFGDSYFDHEQDGRGWPSPADQ